LYYYYYYYIKSKRMRWGGHVASMGEMRNACKILVGKLEEKKTTWKAWM
jgi:hypothetical protein